MMKIKGWRREGRENRVNRSGSGEPAGSRTPLKGLRVRFCSFQTSLSLSKHQNKEEEREALPSLFKHAPEKIKWGGGRSVSGAVAGRSAAAPELYFHFFFENFYTKISAFLPSFMFSR